MRYVVEMGYIAMPRATLCFAILLGAMPGWAQFTSDSGAAVTFSVQPRTMRVEGSAEAAGDIVIQSSPIQAGQPAAFLATASQGATVSLSVFFNTNLANRAQASAATLINNNGTIPSSGIQVTLANFTFASGSVTASWTAAPNSLSLILQLAANSRLVFGAGGKAASIAIRGVRVNASQLGSPQGRVYCAVLADSVGGSASPITVNGSIVQLSGSLAYGLTQGNGAFAFAPAASGQVTLTVAEGFPGAFTTMAQEVALSGTEVTNGTRFDLTIANVPSGLSIQGYQLLQTPNLTLTLVQNGSPISGATAGALSPISVDSGAARITYEVTAASANGNVASAIQVPVLLNAAQSTFVTPAINVSLAPVVNGIATSASPIPRFANASVFTNLRALLLSRRDYVFTALEGSTTPLQQDLQVVGIAISQAALQTSTTSAGAWLTVDRVSLATGPDAVPVKVIVNPTGLKAGDYYGLVTVTASGAANSPQYATVRIRVLPAASPAQPEISPGGLLFNTVAGGAATSQSLSIRNAGGATLTYQLSIQSSGASWLTADRTSGTAGAAASSVAISANPGTLAPGSYDGTITATFSDGSKQIVGTIMVVAPGGGTVSALGFRLAPSAACVPTTLAAVSTAFPNQFHTVVGWPLQVEVKVSDNCNNPVLSAAVIVTRPDGSPPLSLVSLNNGYYVGSLTPSGSQSSLQLKISVFDPPLQLVTLTLNGTASTLDPASPQVGAAVNGASFVQAPVAPGSIVSVFGVNLAGTDNQASLPLPKALGGVTVTIGAQNVPLFYAGPGQVNAQLPWELGAALFASMVVTQGSKISSPQTVALSASQPGIFYYLQNGVMRGAILDSQYRLVDSSNPAAAGSVIQVFATGLGATDLPVSTGDPGPSSPPAKTTGLTEAVIGGLRATIQFTGLAPGFVGLNQINLIVPSGLKPGDNPLTIGVNGASSNPVMLSVN